MDASQYLYAILVGVVLFAVGVIWIVARARGRVGSLRIEPGMPAEQGAGPRAEAPPKKDLSVAPDITSPIAEGSGEAEAVAPVEMPSRSPERALEQGYKGFKIQLRETQPGLWVASIADARNRKKAEASLTHEYYQLPAALAEAKVLIDRRLAARR